MPELSLNALPLLFEQKQQASFFLRQFQPLQDLVLTAAPIQANNSKDSTVGPALLGLPKPNYPPPPPIRLNQLYWPTGAARWARGYFLASKTVAQQLAETSGTAVPFKAEFGSHAIETDLFVLPPHPISCVEGAETLWLVPVVDDRYWWQFRNYGSLGKPTTLTWSVMYAWLATQLGISLSISTLSTDYLAPDPDEFTRRYDNAATLLDAVAHSVGQRIVKQFDGTYQAIDWTTSAEELDANIASRTPWEQIAGDPYPHQPIPAAVTVAFPRLSCGAPDCQRRFYTISTAYSGSNTVVADTVKTIHSSAWAAYDAQGVVTNHAELATLAARIASDYYAGLASAHDYTFAGIKEWYFTGYDDHALYSFGTEDDQPCVTARTSVHESGEADTVVYEQYQRLCTTRIQSPPLNFGVDQMLQQGQAYTEPAGLVAFEIASTLYPGETCSGYPLAWDDDSQTWVADTACALALADPFYRNFLVVGERCWARKNCASGYHDVVGENGLERTGLALASIPGGSAGSVLIYSGPLNDYGYGTPTCTRTSTGIPVSACHLPGSATVNPSDVLFLRYMPDHFKWFIRSNKGSSSVEPPRIAFGTLSADVCPDDDETLFTLVRDVSLIDGTRPDPDIINARCRFGCRGRQGDLAILMRVTDPEPNESDGSSSASSSSSGDGCKLFLSLDVEVVYNYVFGVTFDGFTGKLELTLSPTGVYQATAKTTQYNTLTVLMSIDEDNRALLTISMVDWFGISPPIPLPSTDSTNWVGEDFGFIFTYLNVPVLETDISLPPAISVNVARLERNCGPDEWDVVFIEHKVITPYTRIYFDAQTNKLKGMKRRCAVMYCSDEYEEDILQGTDQCPEGS